MTGPGHDAARLARLLAAIEDGVLSAADDEIMADAREIEGSAGRAAVQVQRILEAALRREMSGAASGDCVHARAPHPTTLRRGLHDER